MRDVWEEKNRKRYRQFDIRYRCGGCVRCKEHLKHPGHYMCSALYGPGEIDKNRIACVNYWDAKQKAKEDADFDAQNERRRQKAWKQNMANAPRACAWEDSYDSRSDKIIPDAVPICPNCREFLYEHDRCYFCGQQIAMDDKLAEFIKPAEKQHMDCFFCGAEGGVEYVDSKVNGHKSGHCTVCGMRFIE